MRLETLNKCLLGFGFLGCGALVGSVLGNQFLPPGAWQIGVLVGLLAMAFAIVMQVGVVLVQRRRRKVRNEQWLATFRQRSLSARAETATGNRDPTSSEESR